MLANELSRPEERSLDIALGHGRLHLARTREAYLDEIEPRDPRGFARWLDSGARAGSDPAKFLTARDHPPPPPQQP